MTTRKARRQIDQFQSFANGLKAKADALADYSRRLQRANGGDETNASLRYYQQSSIFQQIADIADQVVRLPEGSGKQNGQESR